MKRFALIGAAGYIAPRHMRAIRDTGNDLVAALDPNDSVGILDGFFPNADFFREFERFDRHIDKRRHRGIGVHYVSICSPNYLHDAHIRFALRNEAQAICEKPLVLNPWNADALAEVEAQTGARIFNILQLRHHSAILALRQAIAQAPSDRMFDVDLTYITSRGRWYDVSWKGDIERSGGIATNIGVHFFDMLEWVFGPRRASVVHLRDQHTAAGWLEFARARVRWFLSISAEHLPASARRVGAQTYRSIMVDGEEIEFSEGFTDLHTISYQEILAGRGFGLADARSAIETVHEIRNKPVVGLKGDYHPQCIGLLPATAEV